MKQMMNFRINETIKLNLILAACVSIGLLTSCEEEVYPETGSIVDKTPPSAAFSATQGVGLNDEWKTYTFSNQSSSATDFAWDFGDGNSSTDFEPSNEYSGEGTFDVKLIATDKLGVSSTYSEQIVIVEPEAPEAIIPPIYEASFEDNSLPDGTGDGRDSWRLSGAGVIQITSSPAYEGSQAAKFPSAGDRAAYQVLEVTPNSDYTLTYYYTMKTSPTGGNVTVWILPGEVSEFSQIDTAQAIASFAGTDQSSSDDYVKVDLPFSTGANDKVAILVTNELVESRVDSMSITAD
jgi:PKD repeat protein